SLNSQSDWPRGKKILLFALLQWLAVGLAYLLRGQMLQWVPESTGLRVWTDGRTVTIEASKHA
ncbi:MAG: hypothetical protein AB8B96_21715, partial [Lysobacterales bacterium]